jgi:dTDP-4-dehydrorhamnose reductase
VSLLWITGASGFLGRALAARAAAAGLEVDATRVEVRDAEAVAAHVVRARPATVIHTAYRQGGADEWTTNVDGSYRVARAAAAAGARLVHLSTDVVFDGRKGARYVEDDEPRPVTAYGRSKAEAERRVAAAHPEALVVRTSLLLAGPGGEPGRHELAARDDANTFYDDEIRTPVAVADLAAALLELAGSGHAGPLHVAGPEAVSRHELAELVAGGPRRAAAAPPGRPLDCSLDSSRAQGMIRTRLRGVRDLYA